MKITAITPYLFNPRSGKNLLLVRVDTDEGIHGWGECFTCPRKELVVESYLRQMIPYVIGRDVHNIRHTRRVLFDDFAIRRSSLDLSSAWSGIDIALWDIIGKAAGQPLYRLLGGANREKVRLYANGWFEGAGDLAPLSIVDLALQAVLDILVQTWVHYQLGRLGPSGRQLGLPLRHRRPILELSTASRSVAGPLPRDR